MNLRGPGPASNHCGLRGSGISAVTDAAATPKLDVFLSYKREERPVAEALANALMTRGYDVWWDAALLAGEDFATIVHAELTQAQAVVVLWSREARQSPWVRAEAELALTHGSLINAVIDDMAFEGIPPEFSHLQAVRFDGDVDAFHAAIVAAIARKGATPSHPATTVAQATQALQGKVRDADFFKVIAHSTDPAEYEQYLQRFGPSSQFADLALTRIAALRKAEAERQAEAAKLELERRSPWSRLMTGGRYLQAMLGAAAAAVSVAAFFGITALFPPPAVEPAKPPLAVVKEPATESGVDASGQTPAADDATFNGMIPDMEIRPRLETESMFSTDRAPGSAAARMLKSTATVQPGEVAAFKHAPSNSMRNENYGTVSWIGAGTILPLAAEMKFHTGGTATLKIIEGMFTFAPPDLDLTFTDNVVALDGLMGITGLRAANTDIPIGPAATPSTRISLTSAGSLDGSYATLLSADSLTLELAFADGDIGTLEIYKEPDDARLRAILFPEPASTDANSTLTDLIRNWPTDDPASTTAAPASP